MIQPNELRVGNIVKYAESVYKFAGEETTIGDIIIGETDFYDPIPITDEWLLKFGLKNSLLLIKNDSGLLEIWDTSEGIELCSVVEKDDICIFITIDHIKYVHQFQNLYFAITGKELIYHDAGHKLRIFSDGKEIANATATNMPVENLRKILPNISEPQEMTFTPYFNPGEEE